jgi:prepilin-type N-terminal cleavage/methylation domain-containing protein
MDFTTTTIISTHNRRGGQAFSLVELLVTVALAGVFFTAMALMISYNARSCAALANYVDLDMASRHALDLMTKEIRQANRLTSFSSTNLTFEMIDATTGTTNTLAYVYNSSAATLSRQYGGRSTVLLKQLSPNTLTFSIFQRNPVGGAVDQYSTTNASLCKVVQLSWVCSRPLLASLINSESVQSAKVVIRKE